MGFQLPISVPPARGPGLFRLAATSVFIHGTLLALPTVVDPNWAPGSGSSHFTSAGGTTCARHTWRSGPLVPGPGRRHYTRLRGLFPLGIGRVGLPCRLLAC